MSLITVVNLSLSFGGRSILDGLNLQIGERDNVGLIGPNGAGKTTLMRILAGETRPDSGEVQVTGGVRVGYLPQDVSVLHGNTVIDSVLSSIPGKAEKEGLLFDLERSLDSSTDPKLQSDLAVRIADLHEELANFEVQYSPYEARKILGGLGFDAAGMERPVSQLSGGWRMRVALAGLLFQKPDLLLLDEPTNHLDLPSVHWLSTFLEKWHHSLVLICHDRHFLNRHVRRVMSFEPEGFRAYSGNYDTYLEAREVERRVLENRARNMEQKVKDAQKFIDRFKYKSTKARQAQSKIKMLEKLELVATYKPQKKVRFSFPAVDPSGRVAMTLEGVSKAFGNHQVFEDLDLSVLRGDRVAVVGPNGCGKTTLLKIMARELKQDSGSVTLGHNVTLRYYAQHQSETLSDSRTVIEEVYTEAPMASQSFIRGVCGAFLFSDDSVDKPVGVLSGGERARVALAKLLVSPGNVMLMDEPTNHLDLFSSEALIQALEQFEGTLVFVSHNQSFVNRLATRILDLSGTRAQDYPGSLEEYYQHLAELEARESENSQTPEVDRTQKEKSGGTKEDRQARKREEALLRQKKSKLLGPMRKEIEKLEARIQSLEKRQEEISTLLCDENVFKQADVSMPLVTEFGEIKEDIARLMARWETKQAALEEAEKKMED